MNRIVLSQDGWRDGVYWHQGMPYSGVGFERKAGDDVRPYRLLGGRIVGRPRGLACRCVVGQLHHEVEDFLTRSLLDFADVLDALSVQDRPQLRHLQERHRQNGRAVDRYMPRQHSPALFSHLTRFKTGGSSLFIDYLAAVRHPEPRAA